MNLRSIGIAVATIVVAIAVVAGGFLFLLSALGGFGVAGSYTSHYQYEGTLATNETLTNVTLYLPVPVENGTALIDAANVTVETEDGAADWQVELVETPDGPMLALTADRVEGELYYLVHEFDDNGTHLGWEKVPEDELPADMTNKKAYAEPTHYRFSVYVPVEDRIDVTDPVASAAVLPVENPTADACEPYWPDDENAACTTFETPGYVAYDTSADNVAHLALELSGTNEWGFGLSNGFNQFVQKTTVTVTGSHEGWTVMEGELYTGMGDETR
ncbi:hypothetical protein [Haloglomus salinum]|jgi:hypothetical protein|uniref:hypothetical protein n=1 Tax=Haloglomus salinum TaxID=2962673 RepID=UPI0020C94FE7|nr:hypothetical protein [Haloglomus salinum]